MQFTSTFILLASLVASSLAGSVTLQKVLQDIQGVNVGATGLGVALDGLDVNNPTAAQMNQVALHSKNMTSSVVQAANDLINGPKLNNDDGENVETQGVIAGEAVIITLGKLQAKAKAFQKLGNVKSIHDNLYTLFSHYLKLGNGFILVSPNLPLAERAAQLEADIATAYLTAIDALAQLI